MAGMRTSRIEADPVVGGVVSKPALGMANRDIDKETGN